MLNVCIGFRWMCAFRGRWNVNSWYNFWQNYAQRSISFFGWTFHLCYLFLKMNSFKENLVWWRFQFPSCCIIMKCSIETAREYQHSFGQTVRLHYKPKMKRSSFLFSRAHKRFIFTKRLVYSETAKITANKQTSIIRKTIYIFTQLPHHNLLSVFCINSWKFSPNMIRLVYDTAIVLFWFTIKFHRMHIIYVEVVFSVVWEIKWNKLLALASNHIQLTLSFCVSRNKWKVNNRQFRLSVKRFDAINLKAIVTSHRTKRVKQFRPEVFQRSKTI